MPKVAVIGARGHTGNALLPLLHRHPGFDLVAVGSRSAAGALVADQVPGMDGSDLAFSALLAEDVGAVGADAFVLALPNGFASEYVAAIDQSSPQSVIVDLSADYRFDGSWVYGQPERFESKIRGATRIANPGCYATGAQLALAPIIDDLTATPVIFGVSGFSGAGTTPSRKNDPEVLKDNLLPYSLVDHVHEREVGEHLKRPVRFHPHVAPFFRGITLTVSANLAAGTSESELLDRYHRAYDGHRLIDVEAGIPEVTQVRNSHRVIIGGFAVGRNDNRAVALVAVLDNLLKGAATQVVQNLNLAFGMESTTGLEA